MFQGTWQCRRSSYLYAVIAMAHISPNAGVMGSIPIPDSVGIAQLVEHSLLLRVRIPFSMCRDSSMVRALHGGCSEKQKYTASQMVKELKSGLFAGGLSLPSPSERISGGEVATRQLPETG